MDASLSSAAEDARSRFELLPDITWKIFAWLLRHGALSSALVYPESPRRARVVFHADPAILRFR
jgi:hypothetical protein